MTTILHLLACLTTGVAAILFGVLLWEALSRRSAVPICISLNRLCAVLYAVGVAVSILGVVFFWLLVVGVLP